MSAKQYLIDSINADIAKANNLKREDYVKTAKEGFAGDQAAEEGVINSTYDKAAANVQAVNDKKVSDTNTEYASQYERNAVQKLINEKQVAEKMANLGLTDSGLNRTQQTAVQLSYGNQKGKIDLAKQSALDNLALNLTSALTEIETNRSSDLLTVDQKWNDKAYSVGETNYNNDLTAINDRITSAYKEYGDIVKAEIDAAGSQNNNKIYKINYGELANITNSGNDNVKYTDINGNSVEMRAGANPFTNSINRDVLDEFGEYDTSKVFSNGYQPNNYKGDELKAFKSKDKNIPSTFDAFWRTDGLSQTIWESTKGKKYVWVGPNNCYEEVEYSESKKDWVFV